VLFTTPATDNRTCSVNGTNEDITQTAASLHWLINKFAVFCEIQRLITVFSKIHHSALLRATTHSTHPKCCCLKVAFYNHLPIYVHVFQWFPCLQVFQFTNILWSGKAIPLQAWTGPEVSRRLRLPNYQLYAPATFTR